MTDLALGLTPGQLVAGKYRIERVLGRGGMGLVIAARHEQLDQPVALKFLLPEAMRPDIIQRFLREAKAAVKIHSEHVARVFDVGTLESGAPFMVMEYLEGKDLSEVLDQRGPLPVEEAVGFVLESMEAVAEAHALGIVHRDLKPANLFLARRPSGPPIIKVLDFGISKLLSGDAKDAMTSTRAMMGSPSYMSPEQMVAAKDIDARSDIWSLGIVLFELLTREVPFRAESMPEVIAAILSKQPDLLRQARPDAPLSLEAVITRCLEKEPSRRYADLARLAQALAPFGPPRGALSVERITHVLGSPPPPIERVSEGAFPAIETFGRGTLSRSLKLDATRAEPRSIAPAARALVVMAVVAFGAGAAAYAWRGHREHPVARAIAAPVDAPTALPSTAASVPPLDTTASYVPLEPTATLAPAPAPVIATSATSATSAASASSVRGTPPRGTVPRSRPGAPAASSASPASTCRTESFFDGDGNKHFKVVCP